MPDAHTHYHYANGLRGYIPDTSEVFDTKGAAISFAETMFRDSICENCFEAMQEDLEGSGDHNFHSCDKDNETDDGFCFAGAGYVSIEPCAYVNCKEENDDDDDDA